MAEYAERLVEVEQRAKSNTHRINTLEQNTELLNTIAKNTEVMAVEQRHIAEKVDKLDEALDGSAEKIRKDVADDLAALGKRVGALEKVPSGRWNSIVEKIITGVVAAAVAALMALILHG